MSRTTLIALALILAGMALAGCGNDATQPLQVEKVRFFSQESPTDVLKSLRSAYVRQDIADYRRLLADDFRFHLEGATCQKLGLPTFWGVLDDSTGTRGLFKTPFLVSIFVWLEHGPDTAVYQVGRENWRQIALTGGAVEVEELPSETNPEGITYRVQTAGQQFYFRKGRSPDDTPAESATAGQWYLVDWRDPGELNAPGMIGSPTPVEHASWSWLKAMHK
jgi:hypothetical protein